MLNTEYIVDKFLTNSVFVYNHNAHTVTWSKYNNDNAVTSLKCVFYTCTISISN